jgi:hypothetical protein
VIRPANQAETTSASQTLCAGYKAEKQRKGKSDTMVLLHSLHFVKVPKCTGFAGSRVRVNHMTRVAGTTQHTRHGGDDAPPIIPATIGNHEPDKPQICKNVIIDAIPLLGYMVAQGGAN